MHFQNPFEGLILDTCASEITTNIHVHATSRKQTMAYFFGPDFSILGSFLHIFNEICPILA